MALAPVQWPDDDRGEHGVLRREELAAEVGPGLVAQERYEHAYGATFAQLRLLAGSLELASATSW